MYAKILEIVEIASLQKLSSTNNPLREWCGGTDKLAQVCIEEAETTGRWANVALGVGGEQMHEDGAAFSRHHRKAVVAGHDEQVVDMRVEPEVLARAETGQPHELVIGRVTRVVAPRHVALDGHHWQLRDRTRHPVRPVHNALQTPRAHRRDVVALSNFHADARPTNRTGHPRVLQEALVRKCRPQQCHSLWVEPLVVTRQTAVLLVHIAASIAARRH